MTEKKITVAFIATAIGIILVNAMLFGAIIYVIAHFLAKVW